MIQNIKMFSLDKTLLVNFFQQILNSNSIQNDETRKKEKNFETLTLTIS